MANESENICGEHFDEHLMSRKTAGEEMAECAHDDRQADPFLANESKVQALLKLQAEEQERPEMAVMDGQQNKARDINFKRQVWRQLRRACRSSGRCS